MHVLHPHGRLRLMALASAVALAMAATLVTLDPPLAAQGRRGDTGLVTLDFRVVTADGTPVLDLGPGDVTVKVDGHEREIVSLHQIRLATGAEAATPTGPTPPFGSNTSVEGGRNIIVVIDSESISPGREQPLRTAVLDLVAAVTPQDRVGIVEVPQGKAEIELTVEHEAVRAAIAKFSGLRPGVETGEDINCRTLKVLGTVDGLSERIPVDQPTVMIVLSSGLANPAGPTTTQMNSQSGLCPIRVENFNDAGAAVAATRAAFFGILVLDVRASSGTPMSEDMSGGLDSLAGVAGGVLLRLGGTGNAMARAMRETTAFYRLAFSPEASERNDAPHRLEVAVARPDVEVHARSEVRLERRPARPPTPRDMLRDAVVFRDLPLRAAAYSAPSRDESGKVKEDRVKIVALFEPEEAGATLRSAMVGLVDDKGKLTAQWTAQEGELRQLERVAAADVAPTPIMAALEAKPGTYRLRVAATDSQGRAGTVDYEIRAALPEAEVQLSALILGTQLDGGFAPRLLFHDEESAIALLEIYGKVDVPSATLELFDTPEGPAMASAPVQISPAGGGAYLVAFGGFAISTLKPGDYIVRLTVNANGQAVGQASRTLRKVAP